MAHLSIDMLLSLSDKISGPLKHVVSSVKDLGDAADKTAKHFTRLRNQTEQFTKEAKRLEGVGRPLMALGTAGAAGLGAAVVQATTFETAMLGVAKQVEGARDAGGNLTQVYYDMARQVQLLGRELPMATTDIAEMVAAGARMGVARDELIDFTRTAGMMASAFELPAGDLADQMGKIAGLFKIPIPRINELADVINYLDDNAISKGGDIIEVMKRIGGTAEFVKMPANEAAALASTFLTLGSSAEVAATSANAVMRELSIATMQPKRFQAGLQAIGMTAKQVQAGMVQDATGTIQKVLDAINKLPEASRLTVATQLFGKEHGDDIAKLSTGVKEYRRQLALAKSDGAMGSMAREHQARLQSTSAQWQIAKNRISELMVNIGTVLLPTVNAALSVFGSISGAVADFANKNKTLTGVLVGVVAAISGIALVGGGFLMTVGAIASSIGPLLTGIAAMGRLFSMLSGGLRIVTLAFNVLRVAMLANPVGLTIAGIAVAALLIYKYWGPITKFFTGIWKAVVDIAGKMREAGVKLITMLWEGIKSMAMKPVEAIKNIVQKIRNHLPYSPAKEGPLRDINRVRIIETIAGTMKPGPMVRAMRTATAATMIAAAVPGGGSSGGSTITYAPTIHLAAGSSAEVRRQIDEALSISKHEFERMFDRVAAQKQRRSY